MISGFMIVQDEAECVWRAIDSIYGGIDELVVVDGGSQDRTLEIVGRYPKARIFEFPFPDPPNFSTQRNRGLPEVGGDWVLTIDGDEYYPDYIINHVPDLVASDEYDAYCFSRKNFIDGRLTNMLDPDYQIRLFRSYCRYERPLHEGVVGFKNLCLTNLDIHHIKTSRQQHGDNLLYQSMGQVFE